jgi:hypothetical protein
VKAHPEGWVFFLRQREEKFMPPTGGKSLRLNYMKEVSLREAFFLLSITELAR